MEQATVTPDYHHYPDLTGHMKLVTPEMAEEMLSRNSRNRPLSKTYVRALRRELEEGRWKPSHQGVALTPTGELLDGQHRLTAIKESGIPAPLMVTEGVSSEVWSAIDQHNRRTGAQILAMAGVTKDAPRIVAMARAILQVVYGVNKVSNTSAAEYAVRNQTELELFLPVAREYTPAVGAAFAWCAILGWSETIQASERLLSTLWADPQETDPMRALHNRAREFSKLGAGQAGIKARFDIALNCLEAVHDERGLRVARSYRPDYAKLERESHAPEHNGSANVQVPKPGRMPKEYDAEAHAQQVKDYEARLEYDEENQRPLSFTGVSLSPPDDPELAQAVEAELAKGRKERKRG